MNLARGVILSVEEKQERPWTEAGQAIECRLDGEAFDLELDEKVSVCLRIDEVLEAFEHRRVLVASAEKIVGGGKTLGAEDRESLLHPTYLIEESMRLEEDRREWSAEIDDLVREPVCVERVQGIRRSVFVDNLGVSVGDLVDLVRGDLGVEQVQLIFDAVGQLFERLHDAGWVHLGLTPWNIRIFDPESEDGFPRAILTGESDTPRPRPQADLVHENEAQSDEEDKEPASSEDEAFGERDRTIVELEPFGTAGGEGREESKASHSGTGEDVGKDGQNDTEDAEPTIEDTVETVVDESGETAAKGPGFDDSRSGLAGSSIHESEVSWSQLSGETSAAEPAPRLVAIFDGIDRVYPLGRVEEEIAVTPGFSAPELLSGMGTEDGESADIFALGMFLYFLVAGVVPPASVYTRYAPAIPARNFRPTFPPGLQSVISRATRPQPDDRFASVRSMMDAFDDAFSVMNARVLDADSEPPAMRVESDTHIGIAKRRRNPTNQDSVFSASSEDGRFALIVVADGVSTASYGSGDLASRALTKAAGEVWNDILPTYLMDEEFDAVEILRTVLNRANDQIVDHVNANHTPFHGSPHEVMGTTALAALIVDGLVTLASLGDSRVYLQRGAGLEQMTIDHNLWTLSILEGVDADSALAMPHGDALARCLGTFIVDDGQLEAVDPQPDLFRFQVIPGDTLLLTTDGLVDFAGTNLLASEDNILSILLAEPDPALACLELILLANRGGGGDNIGLSVARFY